MQESLQIYTINPYIPAHPFPPAAPACAFQGDHYWPSLARFIDHSAALARTRSCVNTVQVALVFISALFMDPNYYAFATPIMQGLTTVMCVVVWSHDRRHRYLCWMAASQALMGLGLSIQMLLHTEQRLHYSAFTTVLYGASISAMAHAVTQRLRQRTPWAWLLVLNALVLTAMWQASQMHAHTSARFAVMSVYVAAVHAVVMAHWRHWRQASWLDDATAALYGLFGLSMLVRLLLLPIEMPALDAAYISRHLAWWFTTASVMVLCAGLTASLTASALADTTAHLRHERNHDSLTGVMTRRAFEEHCGAQPYAHGLRALVFADIDHFKRINDEHGHAVGDAVLQQVGALLQANVRAVDVVGRMGGEEFALALHGVDHAQAELMVARLAQRLRHHPIMGAPVALTVTASLGWVMLHPDESLGNGMLRADRLLYQAKAAGRNRICCETASA